MYVFHETHKRKVRRTKSIALMKTRLRLLQPHPLVSQHTVVCMHATRANTLLKFEVYIILPLTKIRVRSEQNPFSFLNKTILNNWILNLKV